MGKRGSLRILAIGVSALLVGAVGHAFAGSDSALCAVASHVIRQTATGHRIEGVLYVPLHVEGDPYPVLVLSHGFLRDYGRHVQNALALACAGIITFVPNLVPVDAWNADRAEQVADVVDHLLWLLQRASDPEDPLFGLIDSHCLALAGHSAGGAVSVQALEILQKHGTRISALVLWDAVPDEAALEAAKKLQPLSVLSIRSRPGPCNAYGSTRDLDQSFPFPIQSVFLPSATHCDAESPTDGLCRLLCGGSSESARSDYREKTLSFLSEALKKPTGVKAAQEQ